MVMGDRVVPTSEYVARENGDWPAVAQEQIADESLPEIVAFDPKRDEVAEDVGYGCAGILPEFHDPDRDEPKMEVG